MLAFGLPPAAALVAYTFLIGWGIMFFRNLLYYRSFVLRRYPQFLWIASGVLIKQEKRVFTKSISYVFIKQSVMEKILHWSSVLVAAPGLEENKTDFCVAIPAVTARDLPQRMAEIFPSFPLLPRQLRPSRSSFFRYLYPSLLGIALLPIISFLLKNLLPGWSGVIHYLSLLLILPLLWFLAVRVVDFFTTSLSYDPVSQVLVLRYRRRFSFQTVLLHTDKVVQLTLSRSLLQKSGRLCDVRVYSSGTHSTCHRIKGLHYEQVLALFNNHYSK